MTMITMENYEEYMLLYADGELNEAEAKALLDFIQLHPELAAEMEAYATTKLSPDAAIVYEQKEQLLKSVPAKRIIPLNRKWLYTAAAACIAMVIVLLLKDNNNIDQPIVANNTVTPIQTKQPTPAAIDTQKHQPVQVAIAPKRTHTIIAQQTKQTPLQKVTAPQEPAIQPIAHTEPQQQPLPVQALDIAIAVTEPTEQVVTHTEIPTPTNNRNNKLLALAEEKLGNVNEIGSSINRRIETIKNITGKVKNTDIAFKIGNKELFIVKL